MKQQANLQAEFEQACNLGLMDHYVPFRSYDYSIYYDSFEKNNDTKPSILLNILAAAKQKNTNNLLSDITEDDLEK
jgi:hypothetical protein